MSSQEINRLNQVSELSSSIRQKYENLKRNEQQFQIKQERAFKPILKKVDEIFDGKLPVSLEPKERDNSSEIEQLSLFVDDHIYGIRKNMSNKWTLGYNEIRFTQDKIHLKDSEYVRTDGLLSLLTRRNPKSYTIDDLKNYKQILIDTGAHLNRDKTLRHSRSKKYTNIIQKVFEVNKTPARTRNIEDNFAYNIFKTPSDHIVSSLDDTFEEHKGEGFHLENKKHIKVSKKDIKDNENQNNCHIIFWDDPNQLVER